MAGPQCLPASVGCFSPDRRGPFIIHFILRPSPSSSSSSSSSIVWIPTERQEEASAWNRPHPPLLLASHRNPPSCSVQPNPIPTQFELIRFGLFSLFCCFASKPVLGILVAFLYHFAPVACGLIISVGPSPGRWPCPDDSHIESSVLIRAFVLFHFHLTLLPASCFLAHPALRLALKVIHPHNRCRLAAIWSTTVPFLGHPLIPGHTGIAGRLRRTHLHRLLYILTSHPSSGKPTFGNIHSGFGVSSLLLFRHPAITWAPPSEDLPPTSPGPSRPFRD